MGKKLFKLGQNGNPNKEPVKDKRKFLEWINTYLASAENQKRLTNAINSLTGQERDDLCNTYLASAENQKRLTNAINSLTGQERDDLCIKLREFPIPKLREFGFEGLVDLIIKRQKQHP